MRISAASRKSSCLAVALAFAVQGSSCDGGDVAQDFKIAVRYGNGLSGLHWEVAQ